MPSTTMQGVYPILVTPFHPDGSIDRDSLQSLIDFNLAAGVHGLGVALGSEIFKLSEAERDLVTETVVDRVRGRVPVVINTGAAGTDLAVQYSRRAQELGADALMILPPSFMPASTGEIVDYFRTIAAAVDLPIFLQDTPASPISPALALQLAAESPRLAHVKVETPPVTATVAAMVQQAAGRLTVFGGAGGGYFIEELRRGSVGTMPFCSQPESFVRIWDLFHAGDEAAAMAEFMRYVVPISRFSGQAAGLFYYVHKELLRHRGVLASAHVRSPAPAVDPQLQQELAVLLDELYPA